MSPALALVRVAQVAPSRPSSEPADDDKPRVTDPCDARDVFFDEAGPL